MRGGCSSRSRAPNPDYLALYRVADLFLDTWPYNAHTTASDALWAGCPVLTLRGETFASRVAASLLSAVGLPELICDSVDGYVRKAVALARDADERQRLARRISTAPGAPARCSTPSRRRARWKRRIARWRTNTAGRCASRSIDVAPAA